jgi:hypothetical protein
VAAAPVRFQSSVTGLTRGLCGSFIFVDEIGEDGSARDPLLGEVGGRVVGPGRAELATAAGLGPFPGHHGSPCRSASAAACPGHDPVHTQALRPQAGQRRYHGPVSPLELRLRVRPAKYGGLLTQDQDLGVLRRRGSGQQHQPGQHCDSEPVDQSNLHDDRSSQARAGGRVLDVQQGLGSSSVLCRGN